MENKINVAEILKDKPEKTILYDTMRDINVSLYVVEKRLVARKTVELGEC